MPNLPDTNGLVAKAHYEVASLPIPVPPGFNQIVPTQEKGGRKRVSDRVKSG